MLNALEAQLKQLALDPKDPFATTIRRLVGLQEAPRYSKPLRRFVLAMPTMIREIQAWSGQTEQSPSLRRLQLYALNYLYSPKDFLPDGNLGLFSYLDDVYLLASVMQRTLNESDAIGKRLSIRNKSIRKEFPNWLDMTRQLLPTETMKIDRVLDEINHRGDGAVAWAMSQSAKEGPSSRRLKSKKLFLNKKVKKTEVLMLRAFKEQLKYLSQVSDEVVIKKINIHSHREDGVSLVKPVRNLILVMPDLIEQIRAWSNDSDIPVEEKKLNGFVLTYLYHPVDFLPEAEYGFFGYLDDAYMVGKIFARMTARLQVKQVKMTDNILDISRNINDWLEKVRQVIPEEVKKIDALIDDLSQGHLESFDRLISQEGGGYELNQTRQEEIKSSAI